MQFILKYWEELNATEKKGIIIGVSLIILFTIVLSFWVFKTDYSVLFSDLSDEDAARITEQLKTMKTNYKLDNAGSTILVDSKIVHATRLALTARGALIKGGVGFELFDKTEYGMTDFAQKINFQRALQGELTRTIMSLEAVEAARVHLSLPESSLFETENSHAKASVTLKLKPGEELTVKNIEGIQRLVSASVNGLDINDVSILDDHGNILSKDTNKDESDTVGKMQTKKEVELYLTKKAVSVLEGVFGVGNAIVNVDVTLNYDQVQSQSEHIIPTEGNTGVLIEKKVSSNKKSKPVDSKEDKKDEDINETQELKYSAGREVQNTVNDKGKISRITASVVVPNSANSQQIASLQALIGNTIGIDTTRGDKIEVASISSLMSYDSPKLTNKNATAADATIDNLSKKSWNTKIVDLLKQHWITFSISLVLLFVTIVAFLKFFNKTSLSEKQRQQLLDEILRNIADKGTTQKWSV